MSNKKLYGRDAENFHAIIAITDFFGEKAFKDLEVFIENIYLPQNKYNTMFTLQEHVVVIIDELWKHEKKAYLKKIKEDLQNKNTDYKFTTEKQIASNIRSLGFEIKREKKGNLVVYNPKQLDQWRDRYLSNTEPDNEIVAMKSGQEDQIMNGDDPKSEDKNIIVLNYEL